MACAQLSAGLCLLLASRAVSPGTRRPRVIVQVDDEVALFARPRATAFASRDAPFLSRIKPQRRAATAPSQVLAARLGSIPARIVRDYRAVRYRMSQSKK